MSDLLQYNSFGVASVEKNKMLATATVVKNGVTKSRSLRVEFKKPLAGMTDGDLHIIYFGANLEGEGYRVTLKEFQNSNGNKSISSLKEVKDAIKSILNMMTRIS